MMPLASLNFRMIAETSMQKSVIQCALMREGVPRGGAGQNLCDRKYEAANTFSRLQVC